NAYKLMKSNNILAKSVWPLVFFLVTGIVSSSYGQSDVLNNVKTAMKTGSSKELTRHFHDVVEMVIDGDASDYSKTQAEFVLKDFFKKYPPSDFLYIHQGASKEGIRYAIGKYSFEEGAFRVLLRAKEINDVFLVYSIDFTKE